MSRFENAHDLAHQCIIEYSGKKLRAALFCAAAGLIRLHTEVGEQRRLLQGVVEDHKRILERQDSAADGVGDTKALLDGVLELVNKLGNPEVKDAVSGPSRCLLMAVFANKT